MTALGLLAALGLAGCGGGQSTLSPRSGASGTISTLWWVMLVGSAIIFAIVLTLLAFGLLRRRGTPPEERKKRSPGTTFVVVAGIVLPTVVLVALFVLTIGALPKTSPASASATAMRIDVVGREWFWDVSYPGTTARTANEIHIPVGVAVDVRVTSPDVIHSLWVPELNRKIDVIPGQTNDVVFNARRAGVYRGQCAEFCGVGHAHMALYVVAQPPAQFRQWLAHEAEPAPQPATAELERGQQVLLGSACEYCHRIAGTNASGTIGPDLTHLASRLSLAAATIPNSPGYLAGWILDPQHIKPGNRMPATNLSGPEVQALLAYLESLR